jgi:hypothetical protein
LTDPSFLTIYTQRFVLMRGITWLASMINGDRELGRQRTTSKSRPRPIQVYASKSTRPNYNRKLPSTIRVVSAGEPKHGKDPDGCCWRPGQHCALPSFRLQRNSMRNCYIALSCDLCVTHGVDVLALSAVTISFVSMGKRRKRDTLLHKNRE